MVYINNILLQDDFVTYQDNYTQLLDIRQKYGYMMVIEFGDSMENGVLSNAVGASVKANKFYSTFREIAQGFFECLVGPIMGNRIVLLVPYENAKEDTKTELQLSQEPEIWYINLKTGSTVCSAVESEESKNLEA